MIIKVKIFHQIMDINLRRTWVRIIISLFAGGAISELIHITTGDPNRTQETNLSLLYAVIVFGIISWKVRKRPSQ